MRFFYACHQWDNSFGMIDLKYGESYYSE